MIQWPWAAKPKPDKGQNKGLAYEAELTRLALEDPKSLSSEELRKVQLGRTFFTAARA